MSVLQNMKIAAQRSSNAVPISSTAEAHQHVRTAAVDHVAELTQSLLRGVWHVGMLWLRRRKDRAMLRSLSQRDIHDFCLSQTDAETEMNKPFWRP